jgi:plastocyanin
MPNHSIEIDVSSGVFVYQKKFVHVKLGDQIDWTCNQGPFAIQFLGKTPFTKSDLKFNKGRSQPSQIAPTAQHNFLYRYAVAVYANDQVHLDADCPAIIIDYP